MRKTILLAISVLCLPLHGCNGVFFQPDDVRYSEPSDYVPVPSVVRIPVGSSEGLEAWAFTPVSSTPVPGASTVPTAPGASHASVGATGAPRAVVVHFHGNAQNLTSHVRFVQWIVGHGFALLAFDYRGYGASTGAPSRKGVVEDGEAAIAHAVAWAGTLPGRPPVYVVAQSLGGAIATVAVERHESRAPGTVAGLVLESTFESWRRLAQRKLAQVTLAWPLQVPLSYLVSDELSPGEAIARVRVPLLILHGVDDPVVPFEAGLALYRRATDARGGESAPPGARFVPYPGGHTLAFVDGAQGTRAALVSFLSGERFLAR